MISQTTPEEAAKALEKNPDAVYLDVRSEAEFQAGHPKGAYNVPVVFFDAARRPVPNDDFARVVQAVFPAAKKLLVGCQSGVRSQRAAEILQSLGYQEVNNVQGGFGGAAGVRGWKDSGLPVESDAAVGRSYAELKAKA
jgi:rhodanese-related sulfurtransferase